MPVFVLYSNSLAIVLCLAELVPQDCSVPDLPFALWRTSGHEYNVTFQHPWMQQEGKSGTMLLRTYQCLTSSTLLPGVQHPALIHFSIIAHPRPEQGQWLLTSLIGQANQGEGGAESLTEA